MEGILLRRYGGFYYVESGGQVWTCRLRGRFRREADLLPGDRVEMVPLGPGEGVIEALKPRRTLLERPAVANVEQAIIVFSLSTPPPDLELLDRLLFLSGVKDIQAIIVWNKVDVAREEYRDLPGIYRQIGYSNLIASARTGQGVEKLREVLAGRLSTFAGPSGVGKSSLLNALQPELNLRTGEVSAKGGRGRHTTRHAELIRLPGGGWVADTPGFSRLDLPSLDRLEVAGYFREMEPLIGRCRFNSCLHRGEPGCAVAAAVEAGEIARHRYEHYLNFLAEVIARERSY
ncbi:ribosome small subunit-dependent GTPase A [Neomoorella mulderi]|uniref:Small ribosomal subunit biogenesis GTPase RsgA n=1 Tax=Moorella mulderi DSM 14980 TaxID=1122241 RepID=A0A151AXY1_9FIRM|nr:ribosome small subunit-dependent GTPase A [Moorella mulderi]KYH32519.1 putative ribosome biogenesis GTPase RsgA [Moorella mulderi DSM 14980]